MARKAGAGKTGTAVQRNGSLERRLDGTKDGGGAAQAVSGGSAEAGIAPETNTGFRIPRPLLYFGLGTLGLGAAVYIAVRLVTAVPEPGPEPQPTAVVTPAISQYQKQALEEIALMSQYEPTVAALIPQTDWFNYHGVNGSEAQFIKKIRKYVEQGNYAIGRVAYDDGSITNVLVLSIDKDKREQSLAKTQEYLPKVGALFRIEYKKSLLIIDVYQGGGGAGFTNVDITNPDDLEHELVHTVYEHSKSESTPLAQIPPWLKEGIPELVRRYLKGGDSLLEIGRKNLSADPKSWGIEPLFEMTLKPSSRLGGGSPQSVYEGGFLFLAEYKSLVGDSNFWDALNHIHRWRITNGQIPPHNTIINDTDLQNPTEETKGIIKEQHEELEAILGQHVPADKLPAFEQFYQRRVYDLPTTN